MLSIAELVHARYYIVMYNYNDCTQTVGRPISSTSMLRVWGSWGAGPLTSGQETPASLTVRVHRSCHVTCDGLDSTSGDVFYHCAHVEPYFYSKLYMIV